MQENQNSGRMDTQHLERVETQNPNPATTSQQTQRPPYNNSHRTNSSRPVQHRKKK